MAQRASLSNRVSMAAAMRFGGFTSMARTSELKSIDLAAAAYALANVAVITPINLIRTGSSFFNRIGRKILLKSVHLKGEIQAAGATPVHQFVRIMVIYDKQTNGVLPAIADILTAYDQAGAATTAVTDGRNLDKRDRFITLMDKMSAAPGADPAGTVVNTDQLSTYVERFIKVPNLPTQYQADSVPAVIGDIATGGLYLVTFGENAVGATSHNFAGSVRLRYSDS